ncbi:MAG TPA: acetyl-CoA carboxylase biotin carboxylase subunit, partial [Gemmatimonadales bacterium]|nr:acetyl-CoA carboxylase biotin carboxylase subunit [Gemmatimonadales bacterium]
TGEFYFLEMNTRIQVEHPVTELVFGVDLVREQLRIAMGHPMRVHRGALEPRGHAIECRITSEDPFNGFLPATGVVKYLRIPSGPGVRWDGGVEAGNEVTLHYDPLIAKLIVWGENRETALARMGRALRELVIVGLPTSQAFHLRVLADPDFRSGAIDIGYLDRKGEALLSAPLSEALVKPVAVVAAMLAEERRTGSASGGGSREPSAPVSPWLEVARREGTGQ